MRKSKALERSVGNCEKVLLFLMPLGGLYLTLDGGGFTVLLLEDEELNSRLKLGHTHTHTENTCRDGNGSRAHTLATWTQPVPGRPAVLELLHSFGKNCLELSKDTLCRILHDTETIKEVKNHYLSKETFFKSHCKDI